ncbi:hypothetical protein L596_020583 [Steinernema carpocapsae]|uniref:Uncharacterized protein n=1 Tax=Steinernema carpocapsae TaxID=34508 RepID=A0A4U5MU57_STECR|nr:hypothetical protein L596_020583 [Steinernema carpocapsae]
MREFQLQTTCDISIRKATQFKEEQKLLQVENKTQKSLFNLRQRFLALAATNSKRRWEFKIQESRKSCLKDYAKSPVAETALSALL